MLPSERRFRRICDCAALHLASHLQVRQTGDLPASMRRTAPSLDPTIHNAPVECPGPRQRGEGCNEDEQGLVSAEMAGSSAAKLRITLLAAGFVIGPSGVSVRDITRMTGSNIRSWNEFASVRGKDRKVRTLVIEVRVELGTGCSHPA